MRDERCEVRGARCEVRGARCEVRGARCEVRGARCEVRGVRCGVQRVGEERREMYISASSVITFDPPSYNHGARVEHTEHQLQTKQKGFILEIIGGMQNHPGSISKIKEGVRW